MIIHSKHERKEIKLFQILNVIQLLIKIVRKKVIKIKLNFNVKKIIYFFKLLLIKIIRKN